MHIWFCPICLNHLITARKRSLGQGNVFRSVCHSVHRGRGFCPTPLDADLPGLDRFPPGCRPPGWADPPGVGQTPLDANPSQVGQIPRGWGDPPGCRPPWGWADPPPDTVNKRAVRILLECMLEGNRFTLK